MIQTLEFKTISPNQIQNFKQSTKLDSDITNTWKIGLKSIGFDRVSFLWGLWEKQ